MQHTKIIFIALILFTFMACDNSTTAVSESNAEIINDSEALSTDLVNNPQSDETTDISNAGRLVFTDTVHDFGNLTEGEVITYDFEYKNIGKKEILITEAKGSCGCTVPEWDTAPIAPGATGTMKVTFNSDGKPGYNEKKVLITTSGLPQKYQLIILATVK